MPFDIVFGGLVVPRPLFILLLAFIVYIPCNALLGKTRFYHWVWHIGLVQFCLYMLIYAIIGLLMYR